VQFFCDNVHPFETTQRDTRKEAKFPARTYSFSKVSSVVLNILPAVSELITYVGFSHHEDPDSSVDKKTQLDVTFCILYFSSNSCSTSFGQPCAHHQELTTSNVKATRCTNVSNLFYLSNTVHFFYVSLTVHVSIFITVINQLDAQNVCFTISLFHACTCFEHMCST